jgi:hypothetical protein
MVASECKHAARRPLMASTELLCIECGRPATRVTPDSRPLCEDHARLHPDAAPIGDAAAGAMTDTTPEGEELPASAMDARTATIALAAAAAAADAEPGLEAAAEAELVDMARKVSLGLVAVIFSAALAIVAGAIGVGIFYGVVGYFRGEGEALGGAYGSAAGVAALVVAVIVFVLMRKTLSDRFRRRGY